MSSNKSDKSVLQGELEGRLTNSPLRHVSEDDGMESPLDRGAYVDEEEEKSVNSVKSLQSRSSRKRSGSPADSSSSSSSSTNYNPDPNSNENNGGRWSEKNREESCSLSNIFTILLHSLLEILLFSILFLSPGLLLTLLLPFPKYNILTVKGPEELTNLPMETIRWSVFAAVIYGLWVGLDAVSRVLPLLVRRSWQIANKPLTYVVTCQLAYWRACRKTVNLVIFSLLSLFIFDSLIYGGTTFGLTTRKALAESAALAQSGVTWISQYVEKGLVIATMFALLFALEKYLIQVIATAFHMNALSQRIHASNFKFKVISRLNLQVVQKNHSGINTIYNESRTSIATVEKDMEIAADAEVDMTSKRKARQLAATLWSAICPSDRSYLVPEDFRAHFIPEEVDDAFQVIDQQRVGLVNKKSFIEAIIAIWEERLNLAKSLRVNNFIIRKLDNIFLGIVSMFAFTTSLWYFHPQGYLWISSILGVILSFGFLFKDSCQRVFNSFFFILVEHPFDVGDSVIIDGTPYKILEMEIFTTILLKEADKTITYIPNSALASKNIYNPNRSPIQTDAMLITLPATTPLAKLADLQKLLLVYLQETSPQFTGKVQVLPVDYEDGNINVRIEAKFKDDGASGGGQTGRIARKEATALKVHEFMDQIGLQSV